MSDIETSNEQQHPMPPPPSPENDIMPTETQNPTSPTFNNLLIEQDTMANMSNAEISNEQQHPEPEPTPPDPIEPLTEHNMSDVEISSEQQHPMPDPTPPDPMEGESEGESEKEHEGEGETQDAENGNAVTMTAKPRGSAQRPRRTEKPWWQFEHESWLLALNDHRNRCVEEAMKMDGGHVPKAEFERIDKLIAHTKKRYEKKTAAVTEAREAALKKRQERAEKRKADQLENSEKKKQQAVVAKMAAKSATEKTRADFAAALERTQELMKQGMDPLKAFEEARKEIPI